MTREEEEMQLLRDYSAKKEALDAEIFPGDDLRHVRYQLAREFLRFGEDALGLECYALLGTTAEEIRAEAQRLYEESLQYYQERNKIDAAFRAAKGA